MHGRHGHGHGERPYICTHVHVHKRIHGRRTAWQIIQKRTVRFVRYFLKKLEKRENSAQHSVFLFFLELYTVVMA